jgi:hypothetical protein
MVSLSPCAMRARCQQNRAIGVGALTAVILIAWTLLASGAASADPVPRGRWTLLATSPMYIRAFDARVARAHGLEIRSGANGRQYSVKAGAPVRAVPLNQISGNCGYSYVYGYTSSGSRAIELYTGFHVNDWATGYSWQVRLNDRGGTSFQNWGGGLNFRNNWTGDRVVGGLTPGPGQATVVSANSYAEIWTGSICWSGSPTSTYTIPV